MTTAPPATATLQPPPGRAPSDRAPRRAPSVRVLQWMIVVLLVAGGISFIVKGADEPVDPYLRGAARVPVAGYGEIAFRVSTTAQANRCALLAQTVLQQTQGLIGRDDFGGYEGMLFVYPADSRVAFQMKDVHIPLSAAWFDAGGRFINATDMEPCLDKPECPMYAATAPYRYAIQVPKGGLGGLGVGNGAVISVGGPCA